MTAGFLNLPEPLLIWGLFIRGIGIVYFIAISQLYWQVLPIAGSNGISPVTYKLGKIQRDYGPIKKLLLFPTLLWIHASDRFLKIMIIMGAVASLLVIYGGIFTFPALLLCWMIYLSLDIAVGFTYPWDCVLLEVGFLALFLPQLHRLPEMGVSQIPHPVISWAYRLLLFRVIFGFGKFKFWKANFRDQGYFQAFMVNIPLPSKGAWFFSRFPAWFFLSVLYLTFFIEIISPFFIFLGGTLRVTAAVLISGLMLAIWLVSNFGFFNLITIILCIPLLDTEASIFDFSFSNAGFLDIFICLIVLIVALGSLFNFIFNSWCTFTWLHWPSAMQVKSAVIRGLLYFYRSLLRFRITHAYGVFPAASSPPIKWVPVIEGSQDGVHWEEYTYRYMATNEYSSPKLIAPYHPRLDHAIFYDVFGTNDANFNGSLLGSGFPYEFTHTTGMESILQRILEGSPDVESFFEKIPFAKNQPPLYARVSVYRFQPTSFAELKRTGKWWKRNYVGVHLPARTMQHDFFQHKNILPEQFHWDAVFWKDATTAVMQLQQTALKKEMDVIYLQAVKDQSHSMDEFWNFLLHDACVHEADWKQLPAIRNKLLQKYTLHQLNSFEIIWCRLSLMLEVNIRPHFLQKVQPGLPIDNYFIFGLYIHHIIGKGKNAYESILKNPSAINAYLEDFKMETAFYSYAVFWFETLVYQARKIRLTQKISDIQIDMTLPGFIRLVPFLSEQFKNFGDEFLPEMQKNKKTGEWTIIEN
mgnify:CR=1 FL=1